jgi:hypothetical protein
MSPKDLRDAIAARAAGEDLPGIDPAALDARLAADPALRADLDDLSRLCDVLRESPVPASRPGPAAGRPRPAPASTRRARSRRDRRSLWWIAIPAAAAALILFAVLARWMKDEVEPPAPPVVEEGPPPAVMEALETLREPLPDKKDPKDVSVGRAGGGPSEAAYLDPVLAQAGFPVRLPRDLPEGFDLREVRIRRAAVAGQDLVRLVWEGPEGRLVLVAAPAAPGVREALGRAKPPGGSLVRIEEAAGTVTLLGAAGIPEDRLGAIAAGLR